VELLHERCAALDIGKKDLKACVRTPSPSGKRSRRQEIRTFATTTNALLELRDWLVAEKVSLVVMEATGDYWRGAFYLLEDCLNVILVNAAHAKGLPGRKTDLLTELLGQCGGRDVRGRVGLARFPCRDQRWGCPAGVVRAGGAADWVA
jgi:transposase